MANSVSSFHQLYPSPFARVNEIGEPGVCSRGLPCSHCALKKKKKKLFRFNWCTSNRAMSSLGIMCQETARVNQHRIIYLWLCVDHGRKCSLSIIKLKTQTNAGERNDTNKTNKTSPFPSADTYSNQISLMLIYVTREWLSLALLLYVRTSQTVYF